MDIFGLTYSEFQNLMAAVLALWAVAYVVRVIARVLR